MLHGTDTSGNQFVWVPVGTINNKEGEPSTIDLARYTFNIERNSIFAITGGTGEVKDKYIDGRALKDDSVSAAMQQGISEFAYYEGNNTYTNSKAKNITKFIDNSNTNGGYYIARYEACGRTQDKVISKPGTVWDNVTQETASTKSKEMYNTNLGSYESDLINSYSWDTAIVFIQTYSKDNSAYSKQKSKNSKLGKTGARTDGTTDKVCNIYDMASNVCEWSTESSSRVNKSNPCPCVFRGR